jgi:hypothetical protein
VRTTRRSRTAATAAAALLTAAVAASSTLLGGSPASAATAVTVGARVHFPVVPVGYPASVVASVDRPAGTTVTARLQRHRSSGWATVATMLVPANANDGKARETFPVGTGTTGNRQFRVVAVTADGGSDTSAARTLTVVRMRIRSVHPAGDEYAVVVNRGRRAVDLHGMRIGTPSVVAPFPHRMLGAGDSVRVYTGVGTSTANRLYLSRKGQLWKQHGTAQLTVRRAVPIVVLAQHTF